MNDVDGEDGEIRSLVTELLRDRLGAEVAGADTDLIESGVLDSLALVMLIAAIEEAFACELPLDDFDIELSQRRADLPASAIVEHPGGEGHLMLCGGTRRRQCAR